MSVRALPPSPEVSPTSLSQLQDAFQRKVTYLRISVTDRCDFRCIYCMNDDMRFLRRAQILSLEEITWIGQAFIELGVNKIRITGGEPLVRQNIVSLLENLGQLPGLKNLALTTNGSQLKRFAPALRDAGVKHLNISLDSLKPERFQRLTRLGQLEQVLEGVRAAKQAGFEGVKLNAVILRQRNHDEVLDLLAFALAEQLDISFIEEMPLGWMSDRDREQSYYSSQQILQDLQQKYHLLPTTEQSGGPARYYRLADYPETRVGFISPHSHNFCDTCNRVRLTAEGRLLLCLGQEHSVDLRQVVRTHPGDMQYLKQTIMTAMTLKPKGHDFADSQQPSLLRYMNMTGG